MDNYHIFTLSSGQPIILYQESEKIYMYAIYSGRIQSYGVVLEDVKSGFQHFFSSQHFFCYFSTQGKLRLFSLKDLHFNELLSLPSQKNHTTRILQAELISYEDNGYLLYLVREDSGLCSLISIPLSDSINSVVLYEANMEAHQFYILPSDQGILLQLVSESNTKLLRINSLQTKGNFNILSESEQYRKQIVEKDRLLEENKKKLAALEVTLYEKNNRIAALESTQKHITEQYNELADFAGKLQEELRKARYL